MKKAYLLLIPLMALLVACNEQLKMGYIEGKTISGVDGSFAGSQYSAGNYTYFAGDDVDTTNTNVANFTFAANETTSNIGIEAITAITSCDNTNIEYQIQEASNVGTKEGFGLFIGADSTYVDGHLSIIVNQPVKGVVITARRYYSYVNSWNEENLVSDSNVAVAINSSKYVKVTTNKDAENIPLTTECRFNGQDKNLIDIKVGPQRAFIEKITFYL